MLRGPAQGTTHSFPRRDANGSLAPSSPQNRGRGGRVSVSSTASPNDKNIIASPRGAGQDEAQRPRLLRADLLDPDKNAALAVCNQLEAGTLLAAAVGRLSHLFVLMAWPAHT